MSKTTPTQDCTPKCQSSQHGDILSASITKRSITDQDLASFFTYTCCACENVVDLDGRVTLHVAAACGRTDLVRWLVDSQSANINIRDRESGYTALHRACYYGKIDTVVELIKLGANLTIQDNSGLTYLDHVMLDRFKIHDDQQFGELFTWGSNSNNSLGSQQSRNVPETMDVFHREYPNENVRSIFISQFHCVIVAESGLAYSCGHGQGGRLGLGVQHPEMTPKPIKFPSNEPLQVTSCSISDDHSVFLMSNGEIYTCGLNKHRVLGIAPPPTELLSPKPLGKIFDGNYRVCTGNYHSVIWNKSGVFTWGLNAGQLGHQLLNVQDDTYILTPKRVKSINVKEGVNHIKLVAASTGATVVYMEMGEVLLLHQHQCRKIASRQFNLVHIAVTGGELNTNHDLSYKNQELKVAALNKTDFLLFWQESDPVFRRCIFSINRHLNVKDIALNSNFMVLITRDGEAFKGEVKQRKVRKTEKNDKKTALHKLLDKDEFVEVKVERIPRVHRGLCVASDPKGLNFGVVQTPPHKYFSPPTNTPSEMQLHLTDLLHNSSLTDVDIKVSSSIFPVHKYILSSKSPYFAKLFESQLEPVVLDNFHPVIFEELLRFVYTGTCKLTLVGVVTDQRLLRLNQVEGKKLQNPVRMLHEMAKRFEVVDLQKRLTGLDMVRDEIRVKKGAKYIPPCRISFDRALYPHLYDVEIHCKDDRVIMAHKCVLAARMDYFDSMFSSRWHGDDLSKITLPFPKSVISALLEFLYTDSLDQLENREPDQLFKIIILADQFFVTRLKDQCQSILSDMLTIKNAVQLLTFADAYNADMLKENCFDIIQKNMTCFLEMRFLDDLDVSLLRELSEFYQLRRGVDYRVITPYSTALTDEEISVITSQYPVDLSEKKVSLGMKRHNKKRRSHKTSTSERTLSKSFDDPTSPIIEPLPLSVTPPAPSRLQAILASKNIMEREDVEENFTNLNEFPLLNSPPKSYSRTPKSESKVPFQKMSQKQRKRLSSESKEAPIAGFVVESPKNPWKTWQDLSPLNSPKNDNFDLIISSERKQRENLAKITSKLLVFTQMEDRAIEELRKFYSVDNLEEEVIVIERVSMGAVALPTWVPKTKM